METLEKIDDVEISVSRIFDTAGIYEESFPAVAKFIYSMGGSFEDAKDIFHDAIIIFIEKKSENPLYVIKSEVAFILGISKHLWIRKYQKNSRSISLTSMENEISIPSDYFPTPDNKRLLSFIKITGKKCLDLLRSFYFQQFSIQEIASSLGYSNDHSASAQKYKCLEKVRNAVKEKSLTYDDFTE